jgi:E3 SUMO-protein ligase NSE2
MPHETLWFAVEEGRAQSASFSSTQQSRRRGNKRGAPSNETSFTEPGSQEEEEEEEEESEDELEIASENTRIRCPITFLPYTNPMTCKKCNHSYERDAILQMLENSPVPLSGDQRREVAAIRDVRAQARREAELLALQPRRVQCPEAGCSVAINGEDDLYENQLLKRRVAKMLAREAQKNALATSDIEDDDEDEDNEDVVRGTQRKPVGVTSSPVAPRSAKVKHVKNERISSAGGAGRRDSVVPDSQVDGAGDEASSQGSASRPPRGTQILDLDDDDDE